MMDHVIRGSSLDRKPLLDIADPKDGVYEKNERIERRKLACLFRLLGHYHWDRPTHNHITVKLKENVVLTAPLDLMTWEVTSYNLITENTTQKNRENNNLPERDFKLDSIVYKFRTDARCVVHLQTPCVLAISALAPGLLPLTKDALMLGNISYYTVANEFDESETREFVNQLGPVNKVVVLKNEGMLLVAKSIEEALSLVIHAIYACSTQLNCLTYEANLQILLLRGVDQRGPYSTSQTIPIEMIEFEAHVRMLEHLGYFTGHPWSLPHEASKGDHLIDQTTRSKPSFVDSGASNYDSGVATITTVDGYIRCSLGHMHPLNFDPGYEDDEPVPMSESTKELQIRDAVLFNEPKIGTHAEGNVGHNPNSPIPRRLRVQQKSRSVARRSKSLTSGVERAIFRKQSEKYIYDMRQ